MRPLFVGTIAAVLFLCSSRAGDPDLVSRGESVAVGKTYKLNPTAAERSQGKYDCTTFVQAVLRDVGFNVDGATGRTLNIAGLSEEERNRLASLVEARDSKIKGVVTALVESGQGREITRLADTMRGDIVQMWRTNRSGTVQGHTGIVRSVNGANNSVTLVGAHVDGVGAKDFTLGESGWQTYFIVRPMRIRTPK